MTILEPILHVREVPPVCSRQRQYLPSIRDLVSPTPHHQELEILAYLARGIDCGIYNDPGMLYDVLAPGKKIEFSLLGDLVRNDSTLYPHQIMTDGGWVWPGALLYYVAVYHLQLPERFLRHAERCHWQIDPSRIDLDELSWDAFDAVAVPAVQG